MKHYYFKFLLLFLFSSSISITSYSQLENKVFKKGIETVQCYKVGFPLNPAIIQLNSSDKVHFAFDDLNDEQSIYYYSIIHCNANWEVSDLRLNDYMNGFNENELYDYLYSVNTLQDYTHYSLELPNRDVELLTSGNYILKVFEGMDHDKLIITQRFMVYENEASVKIKVKSSSVVADRDYRQEVDFNVNVGRLQIFNPYDEIKVVVMQNNRWDNAITGLQPKFIKGSELIYDFEEKSSFDGGNEYRNFDIKDLRYQSERIAIINEDSSRVRVFLHPDEKKTFKRYSTWEDLNGNYLIKIDYALNFDTEADYVWVYFTLPFDFPVHNAGLYIGGQFSNYEYSNKYELEYDFERNAYKKRIFIKQGYYNYAYFFLPDDEASGQMAFIEGTHFQTNNDYTVIVYYKDPDKMYDRIVGLQFAVSHL